MKKWALLFAAAYAALLAPWPEVPGLPAVRLAGLALLSALLAMIASALLKEVRILRLFRERADGTGPYATMRYGDIDVHFRWSLDGGGTVFAHEYARLVAERYGRLESVFEFCSGPGFIGFCLLAHGLCRRLTLADVNPKAIEAVRETIRENGLEGRVSVYLSDSLDGLPEGERWDLVVGNPPWLLAPPGPGSLLLCDPGGTVHERFYRTAGKFLKPGGELLLIEGGKYTVPEDFRPMIEKNGLRMLEPIWAAPFGRVFRHMGGYPWLRLAYVVFLRLYLFEHKAYFVRVARATETGRSPERSSQTSA